MLEISDLGLTPRQYAEVQDVDPRLVEGWLEAVSRDGVTNPAAWFLTGLRSGELPEQRYDSDRGRQIHLAERYVERVGIHYDREIDVLDDLFGNRGLLRAHVGDELLRTRMVELWKRQRPVGEQLEREMVERNQRHSVAYHAIKDAEIAERRKARGGAS